MQPLVTLVFHNLPSLYQDFVLSVWEERKVKLYGEHANVHQSHSQNDSGDLKGVTGGDGELGCLCGKAGTSHLCYGSAHSSGCMVNAMASLVPRLPLLRAHNVLRMTLTRQRKVHLGT